MTTGQKIKKYRKEKGLTQKELGLMCGFSEKSAEIRISQYENNVRVPSGKNLEILTEALKVDSRKLISFNVHDALTAISVLEDIKTAHGESFIKAFLMSQNPSADTSKEQEANYDKTTLLNLFKGSIVTVNYDFGDSVQLVPVNKIYEFFSKE